MSDGSNSELESLSNEIARLTKLLATREATSRFLIDSAKEAERRARADEKMAEAKEYAWRDKCDRQKILLRDCLPCMELEILRIQSVLELPWHRDGSMKGETRQLKIKRSKLEALRENIEKELNYAENLEISTGISRRHGIDSGRGARPQTDSERSGACDNSLSRDSETGDRTPESDGRLSGSSDSRGERKV